MPIEFWAFMRWNWTVFAEFWRGYRLLRNAGPCVTVFGSSRFEPDHAYCGLATAIGRGLAERGLTVLSGGGPSTMRAASEGARAAGGRAIGVSILLPHEQRSKDFLDQFVELEHFHVRKSLLMVRSQAFIVLPGGMGTLDELSEIATLIQTGKAPARPIVLVGREYWKGLLDWLSLEVRSSGAISAAELANIQCVDTAEEAIDLATTQKRPTVFSKKQP
jgi:hypothetical protein